MQYLNGISQQNWTEEQRVSSNDQQEEKKKNIPNEKYIQYIKFSLPLLPLLLLRRHVQQRISQLKRAPFFPFYYAKPWRIDVSVWGAGAAAVTLFLLHFFFYKHDTIRDKEKTTEDRTGQGLSSLLVSYLVTRLNFVWQQISDVVVDSAEQMHSGIYHWMLLLFALFSADGDKQQRWRWQWQWRLHGA